MYSKVEMQTCLLLLTESLAILLLRVNPVLLDELVDYNRYLQLVK
jgi:hypothetical protein